MRVLLVNPPYPVCESLTMPLGLLYLAARMEEGDHEVILEDLQLCSAPLRRLRTVLSRTNPKIVGITSFSINLPVASQILRTAKGLYPECITVWGGPHVSFDDINILREHPWVDVIVRGEGEETLAELAHSVKQGRGFEDIPGLTWRKPDGIPQRNVFRPFRENLDQLPRPAWHLLQLSRYKAFGDGASMITSRGCPHRCVFCVGRKMIGARGRFRAPLKVVDEMQALVEIGFQRIRVEDDLFTFRKERALAICRELNRRGLGVGWRAYSRVDTVDSELLTWMRRAGCERILFGAESGSPEILRRVRKGITPEQTRRAVEMAQKAGIGVLASFVLGLPGETPQTMQQTLTFADSLHVPYTLNLLTPYVGTEIREKASAWNLRILSNDWRLYGQGRPLTATPEVGPWHLSRAVSRYRKSLNQYLEDLRQSERQGTLIKEQAEQLQRYQHWNFLRRMIKEDILERYGNLPPGSDDRGEDLAKFLTPLLKMTLGEVKQFLLPHIQDGHISASLMPGGGWQWAWAS